MNNRGPEGLKAIIEPAVSQLGYELVGIEFDARIRALRVYIDHPDGIGVDDCSRVSYQISGILDVEDPIPGHYQLEISSPGMDRPLFELGHFERFIGSLAHIHLRRPIESRRRIKGRLAGVEGDEILIADETGTLRLPLEAIDRARLIPEFPLTTTKG